MKIGATNSSSRNFDDNIPRVQNFWIRDLLHPHVVFSVPTQGFHQDTKPWGWPHTVGTSPVSRNDLKRFNPSCISCRGELPKILLNCNLICSLGISNLRIIRIATPRFMPSSFSQIEP